MTINTQRVFLAQLVTSTAHARLFRELKSCSQAMSNLSGWSDVVRLAGARDSDPAICDALLLPLVNAHALQPDQRLVDVLTVIFWTRLVAVFARVLRYDSDHGELWQNVQLGFLQTIQQPRFGSRGDIMRRVYFSVLRRVHRLYERNWKRRPRLQQVEDCRLSAGHSYGDEQSVVVDFLDEQQAQRDTLARATRCGAIDECEQQLIVATRIEGDAISTIASRLELTPDAAKGRRDRAERRLQAAGYQLPRPRRRCRH